MTVVVRFSSIVANETQHVVIHKVFRMIGHKTLDAVPHRGNCLMVFIQTQHETVLLAIHGHELERIVVDVAKELHARFDTPVPLIVEHERVPKEEARLVAAHVSVADRVAVYDLLRLHLVPDLCRSVLVDEAGKGPMFRGNRAVPGLAGCEGARELDEVVVERLVVQKDPVVVVPVVEAVLHLADGFRNVPDVGIPRQRDKSRIDSLRFDRFGKKARLRH